MSMEKPDLALRVLHCRGTKPQPLFQTAPASLSLLSVHHCTLRPSPLLQTLIHDALQGIDQLQRCSCSSLGCALSATLPWGFAKPSVPSWICMALCETVLLVDSQRVAMNVHPMTAWSKRIAPKRPGHFSPAYRKVPGSSGSTKISETEQRSVCQSTRIFWGRQKSLCLIHFPLHTGSQKLVTSTISSCLSVLGNRNQFILVSTIFPSQRQQNTALNTPHKAHCCYKRCYSALQRALA